jgi:hypothetical protein
MSRIKLLVVAALVAAFALSATAAAASASEYEVGGSPVTGPVSLKTSSFAGTFELSGKPFTVAVRITCTKVHEEGSINTLGTGTAKLEFSSCTVAKPANCSVGTITTEVKTQLLTGGLENEFKPKSGNTFTTITLTGASCSLTTPFEVTGTQVCNLPSGTTPAVKHELSCKTTGSHLEAGSKPATFEGSISGLEVESGALWNSTTP